jgi:hypothetical protein
MKIHQKQKEKQISARLPSNERILRKWRSGLLERKLDKHGRKCVWFTNLKCEDGGENQPIH